MLHLWVELSFNKIDSKYLLDDKSNVKLPDGANYSTDLNSIKDRLDKHIYDGARRMQMSNLEDQKMLRLIRANYIHTSAHYSNKVKIKGFWYPPHKPHDSYLTRDREENNG